MTVVDEPSPLDDLDDIEEQPQVSIPSARVDPDRLWNLGTLVILLCLVILVGVFASIYVNPNTAVNPYPPPTVPVAILLPTSTATIPVPTATPTEAPTETPQPTDTPAPPAPAGPTPTLVSAVEVELPTARANAAYAYELKSAPAPIDASLLYPGRGCDWMGVGGQVSDLSGRPVTGINVQMVGVADGRTMNVVTLTGTALKYGEGGYEFTISDKQVFRSKETFWIQLIDQQRSPLSKRVVFDTFDDCSRNLIVINFTQVR
jgi:hypothetical protein